jgi:hypothetical protein
MFEDEEISNIEDYIEVFNDCVKISLPDLPAFVLSDKELNFSFYNSHLLYDSLDFRCAEFWDSLFTYVLKLRKHKRELYQNLGFKEF